MEKRRRGALQAEELVCKGAAMERTEVFVHGAFWPGSGPEARLWELRLVQGHWETPIGERQVLGLQEAQASLAYVTGWPAVTCGVRHVFSQVF